jgi:hypothetical protein
VLPDPGDYRLTQLDCLLDETNWPSRFRAELDAAVEAVGGEVVAAVFGVNDQRDAQGCCASAQGRVEISVLIPLDEDTTQSQLRSRIAGEFRRVAEAIERIGAARKEALRG